MIKKININNILIYLAVLGHRFSKFRLEDRALFDKWNGFQGSELIGRNGGYKCYARSITTPNFLDRSF